MKDSILCPYCKKSEVMFEHTLINIDSAEECFYAFCPCCKTRTADYEDPMLALAAWVRKDVV